MTRKSDSLPYKEDRHRKIQTTYWRDEEVVKINLASYPNKAVLHCIDHMQKNHYGATSAEVYDVESAEVHASISHDVVGEIGVHIEREVTEDMG
jgi:hypothetical protein